jgi:hypothetical protein
MCRAYRPTLSAQIIHVQRDLLPREPAAARQNQNQQVTPEIERDQMKRNECDDRTNASERNETEIQKEIKEKQIRERSKKQNSERQNKNNSLKRSPDCVEQELPEPLHVRRRLGPCPRTDKQK